MQVLSRRTQNATSFRAYLQPNELQDLSDGLSSIMDLEVKHGIKIRFNLAVEVAAMDGMKSEATADLRKILDESPRRFIELSQTLLEFLSFPRL